MVLLAVSYAKFPPQTRNLFSNFSRVRGQAGRKVASLFWRSVNCERATDPSAHLLLLFFVVGVRGSCRSVSDKEKKCVNYLLDFGGFCDSLFLLCKSLSPLF